jgi:hypothetical protein
MLIQAVPHLLTKAVEANENGKAVPPKGGQVSQYSYSDPPDSHPIPIPPSAFDCCVSYRHHALFCNHLIVRQPICYPDSN